MTEVPDYMADTASASPEVSSLLPISKMLAMWRT